MILILLLRKLTFFFIYQKHLYTDNIIIKGTITGEELVVFHPSRLFMKSIRASLLLHLHQLVR